MFELPADTPRALRSRPRTFNGYPIPWFAAPVNGQLDIRVADGDKILVAARRRLCWVCGQKLRARENWFVIGPMCSVNRISAEPPLHRECAVFSAKYCPFLTRPRMRRNSKDLPEAGFINEGGHERNPGAMLLWNAVDWHIERHGPRARYFKVGEPMMPPEWWAEGEPCDRATAEAAFESGIEVLRETARERDGAAGMAMLEHMIEQARVYLPKPPVSPMARTCPGCLSPLPNSSKVAGASGPEPNPGALSMCAHCGTAAVFQPDLSLALLTDEQLAALLPAERQILGAVAQAVRQANLKRDGTAQPTTHAPTQ